MFREANEAQITHHVDIGFGGVQRDQFGPLPDTKRGCVDPRGLAPNVMDRSKSIKEQLSDDDGFLAAVPPRSSSKDGNREGGSELVGATNRCGTEALVEFFATIVGIDPHLGE